MEKFDTYNHRSEPSPKSGRSMVGEPKNDHRTIYEDKLGRLASDLNNFLT